MPGRAQAGVALTAANLLWASTYAVSALSLSIGAGRLAALRFLVGGALVLYFALHAGLPKGRLLWQAAGLGVLGFAVAFGLQLLGVEFAGPTLAALSITLEPLTTTLVAHFALRERLGRLMPLAFAMAVAGTWLLAGAPLPGHSAHFVGVVFLLLAALCFGFYNVLSKPLVHRIGEFRLTAVGTLAAALVLLPWLAVGGPWPHMGTGEWVFIAYLGIGPTLLAYWLWFFAVRRAPVGFAAFFLYVQPVAGAALGWIWLGEGLSAIQLGGAALVLLGVFLGARPQPDAAQVAA